VAADILRADLPEVLQSRWPGSWQVAANLPYNISSPVLFRFLESRALYSRLILMLQKEVGDRLVAKPCSKEYGILSVLFQLHFDITREFIVKPGSFYPVPKVDSVVLSFIPLPAPRVEVGDELFFRRVVKAAFGQRRKTLWNCLKSLDLVANDQELAQALAECGIEGGRRGETLSLEEFALLSKSLPA
jgi:16S rRNA (adenine1518-N6/adenine1519-N6)-dimethyltransferase